MANASASLPKGTSAPRVFDSAEGIVTPLTKSAVEAASKSLRRAIDRAATDAAQAQLGYELPKVNLPSYELPKYEVPKYEVPKLDVPKVDLPKVDVPKVKYGPVKLRSGNLKHQPNSGKYMLIGIKPTRPTQDPRSPSVYGDDDSDR